MMMVMVFVVVMAMVMMMFAIGNHDQFLPRFQYDGHRAMMVFFHDLFTPIR